MTNTFTLNIGGIDYTEYAAFYPKWGGDLTEILDSGL